MKEKIIRIPENQLMQVVESIAKTYYGGHFTIFSFTTEVKFAFGTINCRDEISELDGYYDINHAIANAIQDAIVKKNI